jgi:hypothetical protein
MEERCSQSLLATEPTHHRPCRGGEKVDLSTTSSWIRGAEVTLVAFEDMDACRENGLTGSHREIGEIREMPGSRDSAFRVFGVVRGLPAQPFDQPVEATETRTPVLTTESADHLGRQGLRASPVRSANRAQVGRQT